MFTHGKNRSGNRQDAKNDQQIIEVIFEHMDNTKEQARARAIEMLARVGIADPDVKVDQYYRDIEVLEQAPFCMIVAGIGGLLGKIIAKADWKLGHVLTGKPHGPVIQRQVGQALEVCSGK